MRSRQPSERALQVLISSRGESGHGEAVSPVRRREAAHRVLPLYRQATKADDAAVYAGVQNDGRWPSCAMQDMLPPAAVSISCVPTKREAFGGSEERQAVPNHRGDHFASDCQAAAPTTHTKATRDEKAISTVALSSAAEMRGIWADVLQCRVRCALPKRRAVSRARDSAHLDAESCVGRSTYRSPIHTAGPRRWNAGFYSETSAVRCCSALSVLPEGDGWAQQELGSHHPHNAWRPGLDHQCPRLLQELQLTQGDAHPCGDGLANRRGLSPDLSTRCDLIPQSADAGQAGSCLGKKVLPSQSFTGDAPARHSCSYTHLKTAFPFPVGQ